MITGASSGIGRACAILCSKLGAKIIACGRNTERLAETISQLSGTGHISMAFDLNDERSIEDNIRGLKGSNPMSGFIHSAGIERTNPLRMVYMDDFVEMFKINVAAATAIAKQITKPAMYDKDGLSIVFISSISGLQGERGKIEYSTTKVALSGLTKSLAMELSAKNVRVNSISPAMVKTQMLGRMFENLPPESVADIERKHLLGIPDAESVANMAVYLISDLAKHITGTNIVVDGGYALS